MTIRGNSAQGEGSVGRGLPVSSMGETSWRQTHLFPPAQITVRLDVGWDRTDCVGMFAGEAWVASTRELLALEVHPLARYDDLELFIGCAQRWQAQLLVDLLDPEPFPDDPDKWGRPF